MGFGPAFTGGRTAAEWIDAFIADSEIADAGKFKASGVYFGPDTGGSAWPISRPILPACPLPTPSGKVELRSDDYARDTGRSAIPAWTDPPADRAGLFSSSRPRRSAALIRRAAAGRPGRQARQDLARVASIPAN